MGVCTTPLMLKIVLPTHSCTGLEPYSWKCFRGKDDPKRTTHLFNPKTHEPI